MSEQNGMPNEGDDWGLIVPFIDQSPEFCLGFEAGMLYGRLLGGSDEYTQTVHTENLGQLRAVAQCVGGWDVRFEPLDETWSVMYVARGTFDASLRPFG